MENIDPRIISGIIGAGAAILGSIISHILVFHYQQKQKKKDLLRISYQFSLLFLERLKLEGVSSIDRKDYYDLVSHISILPNQQRKKIIKFYGAMSSTDLDLDKLNSEISKLQEELALKLL